MPNTDQLVVVLDFGAQYGQLIARRVRDLHVYSEIVPCDVAGRRDCARMAPERHHPVRRPGERVRRGRPDIDPQGLRAGRAGARLLLRPADHGGDARRLGGPHRGGRVRPCEPARARAPRACSTARPIEQTVWMSHRDAVKEVPEGFTVTATTDVCPVAAMECPERKLYATQFHPEVRHTPYGNEHAQELPVRRLRSRAQLDHGQHRRAEWSAEIRDAGGRGPRDPGPVGRRRLVRCGGARRARHRPAR